MLRRSSLSWFPPKCYCKCPCKRKERDVSETRREDSEDGGMDWTDVATSQGIPVAGKKPEEARNRLSHRASGRTRALPTPSFLFSEADFGLVASRTGRESSPVA